MIRIAGLSDLSHIAAIRDSVGAGGFTDPAAIGDAAMAALIREGSLWVWQEGEGDLAGFAAAELSAGAIAALFVAPGHDGKGIGRALLHTACEALRAAGHQQARVHVPIGGSGERHFRAAGWLAVEPAAGRNRVFQKPL